VVLLSLATACIFVSEAEYLEKEAALQDADGDGFVSTAYGGNDCDDRNPTIYPGAADTWYDGVDTDCAGNDDYDADGDGSGASSYGEGDDCDDTDVDFGPHVDETWYDGIDSDCDGGDDYDADGDGFASDAWGGADCDDTTELAYPGADEVWYDGIDGDCGGDSDYDADGDGYDIDSQEGGTDCDDADPSRSPDSAETYADGFDADCDGGDDSMWLGVVGVLDTTGIAGPVLRDAGGYIVMGLGANEANYFGSVYDSVCYAVFGDEIVSDGAIEESCLSWPADYGEFGLAFDFWFDDDWAAWNSLLYDFGSRIWYLDLIEESDSRRPNGAHLVDDGQPDRTFAQASVTVADGVLTGVVCDPTHGDLWAVTNEASNTISYCSTEPQCAETVVTLASSSYGACEVRASDGRLLLSDRDSGEVSVHDITATGLEQVSDALIDERAWNVTAIASNEVDGIAYTVFGDADAGLVVFEQDPEDSVKEASTRTSPTAVGFTHLDVTAGGGRVYVCGVSDLGEAWLFSGEAGGLLTGAQLQVSDVTGCSVLWTRDTLHVAVAADDKIRAGNAGPG